MELPRHVCQALARVHPQLRYAWEGRDGGRFAVVQLYKRDDFGRPTDPDELLTYRQPWDLDLVQNIIGQYSWQRAERGQIFSKNGLPRRDWDQLDREPIFVCTVDEDYYHPNGVPLRPEDIWNGTALQTIKWWLTPIKKRLKTARRDFIKDLDAMAQDKIDSINDKADYLYRNVDNTGDATKGRWHDWENTKKIMEKAERTDTFDDVYQLPE